MLSGAPLPVALSTRGADMMIKSANQDLLRQALSLTAGVGELASDADPNQAAVECRHCWHGGGGKWRRGNQWVAHAVMARWQTRMQRRVYSDIGRW